MLSRRLFFGLAALPVMPAVAAQSPGAVDGDPGEVLEGPVFVIIPWEKRSGLMAGGRFYPIEESRPDGAVPNGWSILPDGAPVLRWKTTTQAFEKAPDETVTIARHG
jgi:hypothetical protein